MLDQLLTLWPEDGNVQACIKQEAEAIDEAVFLAVHQPMRFQRRDVGTSGSVIERSEEDLLTEFMTPNLPEGRLILPIVGSSGVGKSHVIRWIDAQVRRRPDAERFVIIRVPKGSSLKGVLRLLLEKLDGETFDSLRAALSTARDHLDPTRAAMQLQLSLRHRLVQQAAAATERIAAKRGETDDPMRRDMGNARALPAMLGDPELEQSHWLTNINGSPGIIALLAEQVTQEGRSDKDGRRHEFCAADLILDPQIDLQQLSAPARSFYARIQSPERQQYAAALLNRVLDEAKNDLLEFGDNSLVELFAEVRAELFRTQRELIFLVEDFAVLSGIQGSLLQVMIGEATRDGRQTLCAMRSALAYTDGYMAGRDTVLTRARSEWILEDRPGSDAEILERVERLVGAYLNAARVGRDRLARALHDRGSSGLGDWVPACRLNDLEPDVLSVVDAFGRSTDAFPLFPFNHSAVRQLAFRGCVDTRGNLVFNPRHVINNLLTQVLRERPAFVRGAFPPADVADSLRSALVTSEVARRVLPERLDRYLMLLRLWGDQPGSPAEAAATSALIYAAFGLDPVDFGVSPTRPPPPTRPMIRESAAEAEERRWVDQLDAWGTGATMAQSDAAKLKGWVAEAMFAFLPTDVLLLRPRVKGRDLLSKVYLPRSPAQGGLLPGGEFIAVAQESDLADPVRRSKVVQTLLAFVRRYETQRSWNYPGGEEARGLVGEFLVVRSKLAAAYLRARHFQTDANAMPALVRGLLIGARALGIPGAHDRASLSDLVNAVLDEAKPPSENVSGAWADLQRSLSSTRAKWQSLLLEHVGARQGGAGAVHAVDCAELGPLVVAASADWALKDAPPANNNDAEYSDFVRRFNDARVSVESAIREEEAALLSWHPISIAWFSEGADKGEVQETLRKLVTEAKLRGLAPAADYEAVRRTISELAGVALAGAAQAATRLKGPMTRGEKLSVLAALPGRAIAPATQFIKEIDAFLAQVDNGLGGREAEFNDQVVQDALNEVDECLSNLDLLLTQCSEENE